MSRHLIKLDDGSGPLCYIDILGDESTEDLFVENTPANIREYYRLAECNYRRLEWVSPYKMQLPCVYSHIDPLPIVFGAYKRSLIQSCESVPIGTPLPKELPTDYHLWSNDLIRGIYHKDEIRAIEQWHLDAMDDVLSGRPIEPPLVSNDNRDKSGEDVTWVYLGSPVIEESSVFTESYSEAKQRLLDISQRMKASTSTLSDEVLVGEIWVSPVNPDQIPMDALGKVVGLLDEREEINEQYKDELVKEINRNMKEGSSNAESRTETLAEGSPSEDQSR